MTEPSAQPTSPRRPTLTHLDALPKGERLGEFEVTGLLGIGGFGIVYQAYDHSLQRDVAIKEYLPASLARRSDGPSVILRSSVDEQPFEDGLKSFIGEARLLAQFDHASLVKVFRFWEQNETAYMVMPLYRGMTLKQARRWMRSAPSEEWMRKVLWSILGALKVLHAGKTMHRDVSPENIFLQDLGPPVLLDLGAARRAIGEKSQNLTATLKFSYAPIEQYGDDPGLRQGPWTDLYALAAVVYGCLSNELPLPATLRAVRDRMPSLGEVTAKIEAEHGLAYTPEFVAAIDQALSLRPKGRPHSVGNFARIMNLQPPMGMSKFDWRAELGPIYRPPVAPAPANKATESVEPAGEAVSVPAVPVTTHAPNPTETEPVVHFSGGRGNEAPLRVRHWQMVLLAAAVVGGFAWLDFSRRAPTQSDAASMPATMASAAVPSLPLASAPASVTPPASAPTVEAVPVVPVASTAQPEAPVPSGVTPSTSTVRPRAPRVANPGAEPKGKVARQANPGKAVVAAPAVQPIEPTVAPVVTAIPVPVQHKGSEPVPTSRSVAQSKVSPESNCADQSFVMQPMGMYRVCQRPEFAALPVCVQSTKNWSDRRPMSN